MDIISAIFETGCVAVHVLVIVLVTDFCRIAGETPLVRKSKHFIYTYNASRFSLNQKQKKQRKAVGCLKRWNENGGLVKKWRIHRTQTNI